MPIRANLNVHKDVPLRDFIDSRDWITCYLLPAYAPDLNPRRGHLVTAETQQPGAARATLLGPDASFHTLVARPAGRLRPHEGVTQVVGPDNCVG